MKKKILLAIFILIIIAGIIIFFFLQKSITGEVVRDTYSFTKAICNGSNFCQDYEIVCEGNRTISRSPLSGAVVQHNLEWKDPREEKFRDKECENFYRG